MGREGAELERRKGRKGMRERRGEENGIGEGEGKEEEKRRGEVIREV